MRGIRIFTTLPTANAGWKAVSPPAPNPRGKASALFYEDPLQITALQLKSHMPGLAESLSNASGTTNPIVMSFYGEDSAIREVSANHRLTPRY